MNQPFLDGLPEIPDELAAVLAEPLIDHHVHGCFTVEVERAAFEESLNEASTDPIPDFMTQFDSQLGFVVRRWCAPLLGLAPHPAPEQYWARRSELGAVGAARALIPAAGVAEWLVDTGFAADTLCTPAELATWSDGRAREVVRLESLAESLLVDGVDAGEFADGFRSRLAEARDRGVAGAKTIAAYRCGFAIDWSRPTEAAVVRAARSAGTGRLTDPTLVSFGVHEAADAGLPIQVHVGLGDRDLDLQRADPLLLGPLLRQPAIARVPVLLLHCYPFHRGAGYLAQAFGNVHMDVGLAINHLGAGSVGLLAEALELAPFAKQLYSSDACGPPELHLLGAVLWRRGMARVLGGWVREGDWSLPDAVRVVRMIGAGNAARVYGR